MWYNNKQGEQSLSILINYTPGKSQGSETDMLRQRNARLATIPLAKARGLKHELPLVVLVFQQLYPWQKPGISCNKMNMINEKQPPDQCDQEVVFFPAFCLSLSGNYGIIEIETKANTNSKYKEELS